MSQFFWTQRRSPYAQPVDNPVVPASPTCPDITFRTWKLIRQCTHQFRSEGFTGRQAQRLGYITALQVDGWEIEAAKAEGLRVFPREEWER